MAEKNSQDGLERLGFLTTSDSHVADLRIANDDIKGIGSYLTERGIHEVLAARQSSLARQGRLQWSLEMTEKLLERASSSPYAEQDTLPQVIADWFEVILYIQNQTTDFIADDDIIFAVAEYYDNFCAGDADLLRGKAADRIIKNFRMKKDLYRGANNTPGRETSFEDEEAEISPEENVLPLTETFRRNIFAVREPSEFKDSGSRSDLRVASNMDNASGDESEDASQMDSKAHAPRPGAQLRRKSNHPEEEAHEILALFQKELNHYVGEGSTSVSERIGRNIFASVRFTLSLAPAAAASPSAAASVEQRFCDGQRRLLSLMEESERDFRAILAMKIHLPLDTYYGTLYREIPTFFRLYDGQYAAHETPALMDYPLAIEIENLSGIVYIHEYLRRMRIECEYIHRVTETLCSELISAYSRKYDMDITSVPVNFFEILMGQAFAAALILDHDGKDCTAVWNIKDDNPLIDLWLHPVSACLPTLSALSALSFPERRERIAGVCEAVCGFPDASGPQTVEYAHIYADRWIILFESTLENQCPENLILFPPVNAQEEDTEAPSYFVQGEPMPDDEYTELVEKLSAAADVKEQNQLIRTNVHSRKDLLDILQEDFWMPGEKDVFLATFSPEEQALFAREGEPDAPQLGKK
ncbi:MAG: DUF6323 family protein [Eubacteriales bacterium]